MKKANLLKLKLQEILKLLRNHLIVFHLFLIPLGILKKEELKKTSGDFKDFVGMNRNLSR